MNPQHDDAGASSAPGEVAEIRVPLPGWWKSRRLGILGLAVGAMVALGGFAARAAVTYVKHQVERIDRIEERDTWRDWTIFRIAEKVGVADVKPPPKPGD